MWVFIRPEVVRSANEERLSQARNSVQFIVSMEKISFPPPFEERCKI